MSEYSDEYEYEDESEEAGHSADYGDYIPPSVMENAQPVPRTNDERILCSLQNEIGDMMLRLLNDDNNPEATAEFMAVDLDPVLEVIDLLETPAFLMDKIMRRYHQYSFIISSIHRIFFHKSAKYDDVVAGLTHMVTLPNHGSWEDKIIELRCIEPRRKNLGKIPQNKTLVEAGITNHSVIKVILVDI